MLYEIAFTIRDGDFEYSLKNYVEAESHFAAWRTWLEGMGAPENFECIDHAQKWYQEKGDYRIYKIENVGPATLELPKRTLYLNDVFERDQIWFKSSEAHHYIFRGTERCFIWDFPGNQSFVIDVHLRSAWNPVACFFMETSFLDRETMLQNGWQEANPQTPLLQPSLLLPETQPQA